MDELSVTGESVVCTFSGDECITHTMSPEDAGLRRRRSEEIAATGHLGQEALRFLQVLGGKGHDGCIDFTCLNAAAILTVAGRCDDIRTGVEMSRDAIGSGRSLEKLRQWVTTQDSTGGQGTERLDRLMNEAGV
jgi:anthranilate phosphoribosyltransferase